MREKVFGVPTADEHRGFKPAKQARVVKTILI